MGGKTRSVGLNGLKISKRQPDTPFSHPPFFAPLLQGIEGSRGLPGVRVSLFLSALMCPAPRMISGELNSQLCVVLCKLSMCSSLSFCRVTLETEVLWERR